MLNLEKCLPGKPAIKDSLNWVLIDFKNVREFEEISAGFVLFEAETKATSEGVETGDWKGLAWLRKDYRLEFENLSSLFLDFHIVVVTVIAYSLLLFGDRGGLRHGFFGCEVVKES